MSWKLINEPKICAFCEQPFIAKKNKLQVYCSRTCVEKATYWSLDPVERRKRSTRYKQLHPDRAEAAAQKWRKSSAGKACHAKSKLKRHQMSFEEYNSLLEIQKGGCAVCGEGPQIGKRLLVDHDHGCCTPPHSCPKCRRGLLCVRCNLGLGYFRDSLEHLKKATEYLAKFKEVQNV